MKISELIAELEKIKEEHGDVRVEIFNEDDAFDDLRLTFYRSTPWTKDMVEISPCLSPTNW